MQGAQLFYVIMVMTVNVTLCAMNQLPGLSGQNCPENLGITIPVLHAQPRTFYFCLYDFETMNESDKKGFLSLYDYAGVLNVLNSIPQAKSLSDLAVQDPDQFFKDACLRRQNRLAQFHNQKFFSCAWVIKEYDHEGQAKIIGQIGLGTYAGQRPLEYAMANLVEIGLTMHADYRAKGYATMLIPLFLKSLRTYEHFKDAIFCFKTQSVNQATHRIANKFGFKLVMRALTEIDLGSSRMNVETDLFVLPHLLSFEG